MGARQTTKEYVHEVSKIHNNKFDYSKTVYTYANSPIKIICPIHGEFEQNASVHKRGFGCKKCSREEARKRYSHTPEQFLKDFLEKGDKNIKLLDYKEYVNNNIPVNISCKVCKKKWTMRPSHLKNGRGCPDCKNRVNGLDKRYDLKWVQSKIDSIQGKGKYLVFKDYPYENRDSIIKVGCLKCANIEKVKATRWWWGRYTCTKCYPRFTSNISQLEKSILKYVKLIYKGSKSVSDRSLIKPQELDIVIPEFKLAIEVNGVYWHSSVHKLSNYHYKKQKITNEKGYHIFNIWEDQWVDKSKRMIIKSMLKSKLGKIKNKIFARKTEVRVLDKTPIDFYNTNHLQGSTNSTHNYGLFYDDELVSAMSFKKDGELIRFATKLNTQVIGGFSKLLKAYIRDYPKQEITSFSDNDYSDGGLYRGNNFSLVKELKQDYFYIKVFGTGDIKRYHKMTYRKNKIALDNANKTERELTGELGLLRCYNSGKSKWVIKSI